MVKFGIIGAGGISAAFARAAAVTEGIQLAAVAAQDMTRAQRFASEFRIPHAYGNYAQILSDRSVDAVYIGNTTNFHYSCIKMCLAAGKHVLCEKAMVETEERARECFDLARGKGLFLMEAMWSRFLPKTKKVREWVRSGRIGSITGVQATIGNYVEKDPENRFYSPALGGGAMYDLGVYPIELIPYFTGLDITSYSARILRANTGVDETVSLNLDLEGVPAHALITFNAAVPEDCWIYGEHGCIKIPRLHWGSDAVLYTPDMKEAEHFSQPDDNNMRFEIEEAVHCITEGFSTSDIATPEMTLQACRIYDSILGKR